MKIILVILIYVVFFSLVYVIPFIDIYKNNTLSTRAKWNCSFVVVLLPVVGAIAYFLYKWYVKSRKPVKMRDIQI
ncbi:MAG: PLDc N-terminal domain-containing protein [Paludibacter sp.]|jgi:hypothetical protein|nr:PLDc N-terminal domain-containing protein [Paludibacter sp.]